MNLALVGNGNIVHSALEALQSVDGINVHALCVRAQSESKGKALQQKYAIPVLYTDYEMLLNDADIDAVYIGIVNLLHYEYAKKALSAGKHVIVEKPSCVHSEEIRELAALAMSDNLFLFEAVTFLHADFFRHLQDALPQIGKIKIVQCNFSKYSSRYNQYLDGVVHPVFDPACAGGTLLDLNIYNLNFVISLFGKPQDAVYYPVMGYNGVDTSGIAILSYPSFVAECTAAKDSSSPGFMQVQGEKGWIKIEGEPDNLKALHICIDNKVRTISFVTEKHRMVDEFSDFLMMYEKQDVGRMKHFLDISVCVCEVAEKCLASVGGQSDK